MAVTAVGGSSGALQQPNLCVRAKECEHKRVNRRDKQVVGLTAVDAARTAASNEADLVDEGGGAR